MVKDLGSCDIYPGTLVHSPNGRFVAVCGDGEYIIYTALAWRNKSYGSALSFVWGEDSNIFATRDSSSSIRWGALQRGLHAYSHARSHHTSRPPPVTGPPTLRDKVCAVLALQCLQ